VLYEGGDLWRGFHRGLWFRLWRGGLLNRLGLGAICRLLILCSRGRMAEGPHGGESSPFAWGMLSRFVVC
jgi:hypothetical protein